MAKEYWWATQWWEPISKKWHTEPWGKNLWREAQNCIDEEREFGKQTGRKGWKYRVRKVGFIDGKE